MSARESKRAATIGEQSVWPYADRKLRSGSILWVANGIKLGVVNINRDGSVPVSFFGSDDGPSTSSTLRLGEPVEYAGVRVTMTDCAVEESPRWITILAQPVGATDTADVLDSTRTRGAE